MLRADQYLKTVRRPYPPLFASIILQGFRTKVYFKEFLSKSYSMKDLILSDGYWHYSLSDYEIARKQAFRDWYNAKTLSKVIDEFKRRERRLSSAYNGDFKSWALTYEQYMPAVLLIFSVDRLVADKVSRLLTAKIDEPDVSRLMDILNIPVQDNFFKQEEYDLITTINLNSHVKRYEWINSRYGEIEPYTIIQARRKSRQINKQQYLRDRNEQKSKVVDAIAYAKGLLSPKDRVAIDFMQFVVYYRTQRTDVMNRAQYHFASKLRKIAKKRGLTYQELLYCTEKEVLVKVPSKKIIHEREMDHAMVLENGRVYCVAGEDSKRIRKMFAEVTNDISVINGNTAFLGMVKGRVRLVMSSKEFPLFKRGEILVTSMTNPHMVPIMKKAAAFVTDEGGITCHAAIMAREMKKPCVIGSKIATKVFKDGDMVEVDANKGIVRKI